MRDMTLEEYRTAAMVTRMDTCDNVTYMLTELTAEVGELNDKIAKAKRKGWLRIDGDCISLSDEGRVHYDELAKGIEGELGDILWALAGCCTVFGFSLEGIATGNLKKLADRARRGVIDGTGDNR